MNEKSKCVNENLSPMNEKSKRMNENLSLMNEKSKYLNENSERIDEITVSRNVSNQTYIPVIYLYDTMSIKERVEGGDNDVLRS